MPLPILQTKLYVPVPQSKAVARPRLIETLKRGKHHKLTLISAPAGFGKTTLVSEMLADDGRPVGWLSLDEGDNDPLRFLTHLVAALQLVAAKLLAESHENFGQGVLAALESPQPPPLEAILTALVNEISTLQDDFVLVLDDYH